MCPKSPLSVSRKWGPQPRGQSIKLFSALRFDVVCFVGFWTCLGTVTPSFPPVFPLGEMSILCLPHHCILETHNLFDFKGSKLEGDLPQDELYLVSHPYLS